MKPELCTHVMTSKPDGRGVVTQGVTRERYRKRVRERGRERGEARERGERVCGSDKHSQQN